MDVNKTGWYSRLIISGLSEVRTHDGPVAELVIQAMRDLRELTPRKGADGHKEITIQLSTQRLDKTKEQLMSERVAEVEAGIDWGEIEVVDMTLEELTEKLRRERENSD